MEVEGKGRERKGKGKLMCAYSEEFLRDGDQLAARMTGVLQLDGVETFYECFFFAQVDAESGKLASLTERAVWGEVGKEEVQGTF